LQKDTSKKFEDTTDLGKLLKKAIDKMKAEHPTKCKKDDSTPSNEPTSTVTPSNDLPDKDVEGVSKPA